MAQSKYTALQAFSVNFTQKIDQFISEFPVYGEQGYHWRPEVEMAVKEEMVACLNRTAETMVHCKMIASDQDTALITREATCSFFQNLALEKRIQARIQAQGKRDLAEGLEHEDIPAAIPEAGGEGARPLIEPVGGDNHCTPPHSSAGTHITAV